MRFLIFFSFLFFTCTSLPKQPIQPEGLQRGDFSYAIQKANWNLEVLIQATKLQGLSVLVVDSQKELFYKGHGLEDGQKEIDKNTKFFIGSVSKVITALLVLKLVEEKKIFLDKPITDYLKSLKLIPRNSTDPPPTVRQILYHHSGLPSDILNGFLSVSLETANSSEYRHLANSKIYMAEKPGKVMSYSNLGYSLLGCLIEVVSKKSLEDFAKEKIFLPLEMNHTSYYYPQFPKNGYKKTKSIEVVYIRDLPAGSIVSTASDMGKLLQMFLNEGRFQGKILFQSSTLQEMRTSQKSSVYDFDFKIGLPFWFANDFIDKMQMVGHGGDIPPYHAYFGFDVYSKLGIILMTNTLSSSAELEKTALSILGDFFEAKTGNKPTSNLALKNPKAISKSEFQKWEGNYLTPTGWIKLQAKEKWLSTNQNIVFVPKRENEFSYEVRLLWELIPIYLEAFSPLRVKFTKGESGEKFFAIGYGNKLFIMYGIETKLSPIFPKWKTRVGKYKIENSTKEFLTDFSLEYNEKESLAYLNYKLNLVQPIPVRVAVEVLSEDLGYLASLGRNQGVALVWKRDELGEYLEFSGYKLRQEK